MFNTIKNNPIPFILLLLLITAPALFFDLMTVALYIILGIIVLFVILGLVFRNKIRKIQQDMEAQMKNGGQGFRNASQGGFSSKGDQRTEGDVKIYQQGGSSEKKVAKDVGDYVKFEEVKEK